MADDIHPCFDPFGEVNARQYANVHQPVAQPMTLIFQYATANVVVEGPTSVLVTPIQDNYERRFERIFRLLLRVPNQRVESWAVYRRKREWDESDETDRGCVLRRSVWDMKLDMANETWRVGGGPTIQSATRYIGADDCRELGPAFAPLDRLVAGGIRLSERPEAKTPTWQEMSVWRSRAWGLVDITWNSFMRNTAAEDAALNLANAIERVLQQAEHDSLKVQWMRLVYPSTPYLVLS